ncbi:hypothetical protein PR202_gb21342 [Eleusine coracana subsp. coracana]|uniref:Uncharacterized protein n=1 Tax=Eleusine coracana subsp. coracana TaxID=191504 RepID=A0AAV5FCV2_ELECO|nr:hypothetical protein PR202_gb21342 [Eleusine coracana subsp. coracana]
MAVPPIAPESCDVRDWAHLDALAADLIAEYVLGNNRARALTTCAHKVFWTAGSNPGVGSCSRTPSTTASAATGGA